MADSKGLPEPILRAEFVELLHNLQEHVEHLEQIFERKLAWGTAKDRILKHLDHEETRRQADIEDLRARAGGAYDWELVVVRDHSRFVQDICRGSELDHQMVIHLLHHMAEEHEELFKRFGGRPDEGSPPAFGGRGGGGLTVGEL